MQPFPARPESRTHARRGTTRPGPAPARPRPHQPPHWVPARNPERRDDGIERNRAHSATTVLPQPPRPTTPRTASPQTPSSFRRRPESRTHARRGTTARTSTRVRSRPLRAVSQHPGRHMARNRRRILANGISPGKSMSSPAAPRQIGTIEAVQGPVVDIVCDHPPPLHRALYAQPNGEPCLLEVFRELGERHVRAIALHRTAGLARGLAVMDSGGPSRSRSGRSAWVACSTSSAPRSTARPPSRRPITARWSRRPGRSPRLAPPRACSRPASR